MTSLYYPPKFDSGLPGAKLWFTATGTTVPQDTYTDETLLVASSNPVVADAAGIFAPIYLDPRLPSYRVKYTTSADVLLYQVDNYPSNQNKTTSIRLESTDPKVFLYDTDGTVDSRKIRIRVFGNLFQIQSLNDSESVPTTLISATGGVVDLATGATVNGSTISTSTSGSFTGVLTGMTATTNVTVNWIKNGSVVHMYVASGTTGTSNATTLTMTGLPASVTPAVSRTVPCTNIIDSGNSLAGIATVVGAGNSITFSLYRTGTVANRVDYNSGIFTNSGNKGIFDGWSITYAV